MSWLSWFLGACFGASWMGVFLSWKFKITRRQEFKWTCPHCPKGTEMIAESSDWNAVLWFAERHYNAAHRNEEG